MHFQASCVVHLGIYSNMSICRLILASLFEYAAGSALRAASNSLSFNLPSASQSSLSVDLLSTDTFSAPVLEDFKVPEITSEDIPFLEAQAQEAEVAKRKAQYRALEEDDLKIEVKMGSVISKTKYFVTPPPSTCEGASGPAAKLLDCTTTFPAVKLTGFGVND